MKILNLHNSEPYIIFNTFLQKVIDKQKNYDAIAISSYNKDENEVDSRFVNLKYIDEEQWIFFSNFNSKKAKDFHAHDQISALIYWSAIDVQIRIKAKIFKVSSKFSDLHFKSRNISKNILSISSKQSQKIDSYESVIKKYKKFSDKYNNININRPSYWGGYSFKPFYFEFWEGQESRINKRQVFKKVDNKWEKFYLEP
tara:strand:- start:4050 stop:4646 length:597 start_codon:yes stop_codon:yes gene_type:complete